MTAHNDPLPLVEDSATGDRFLVYSTDRGVQVHLKVDGDTFWATEQQIADMFGVTRQNINLHARNVFNQGELVESAVCKESLHTGRDGKCYPTKFYDLNALISVGYRVGGKQGTMFRVWATDKLFQYLTKGFVVDPERLKAPGQADRVAELREIIRDIRASEANVYAELRQICSLCQDYDPGSEEWRQFYQRTQAKLFWAVTNHTPAEIMLERANANLPNMGLVTWQNENIRKSDAGTAKNYLSNPELRELNRLTTLLLDIFDDQLSIGRLTLMSQVTTLLDNQLRNLGRSVLNSGGRVSHEDAEGRAREEYRKFDEQRRTSRVETAVQQLAALKAAEKLLAQKKRRSSE